LDNRYNLLLIKLQSVDFESTIKTLKYWRKLMTLRFEFSFLDAQLNQTVSGRANMASVLDIFSLLGVVHCKHGFYWAIAALAFRQRTKEVSLRKVMGASLPSLIVLLVERLYRLV